MSHWDPNNIECKNCKNKQMINIVEQDGEWIHWCGDCGTILTANKFDPISSSDWRVPLLCESALVPLNSISRRC